jgi:hypothetical protein
MYVNPIAANDATTGGEYIQLGNDDLDLEDEVLLDLE